MNVENFKRVLDHIKAHPETWNQEKWHCGTAHCFAGHAQIMSGHPIDKYYVEEDAKIFLNISYEQAVYLFMANRTIADFEAILASGFPSHVSGAT